MACMRYVLPCMHVVCWTPAAAVQQLCWRVDVRALGSCLGMAKSAMRMALSCRNATSGLLFG